MGTTFTDEQRLLRETVIDLARDHRAASESIGEQRGSASAAEVVGELGLLTMRWPEAAGGIDAGAQDVVLVAEALGAGPAVVPFVGPSLAAELVLRAGCGADELAELASSGPLTIGLDPQHLGLATGRALAWDAAGARAAAALDGEHLVIRQAAGELPSADLTRLVTEVDPGDPVRALPLPDAEELNRWEAFALTILSADLVGVMAGAIDLALTYAKDREQFGKPVGSFQALAHLLADAHVQLEAARSTVRHAAVCVDAAPAVEALLAARVAKAYTSRVALGVTEVNVQVHGAIGTTWESLCHIFVRRALTDAAVLGNEDDQLGRLADIRLGRIDDR